MFVSLFVLFVCCVSILGVVLIVVIFLLLCFLESVLTSFYEFPLTILFTPK